MEILREQEKEYRKGDHGIKYFFRGPQLDWGLVYLKPGEKMGSHYHREVEEAFYILEGRGTLLVNEMEVAVESGFAFRLEAGERHDLVAAPDILLKGIFIKNPFRPDDKVE
ncbi:MAG TPA: cupin domain-containing protein [Atribacteraceae bacterium]|nr:cupin domain-containing protein [Atribacteraceae bacterium]